MRKPAKPVTRPRLERIALAYLERFPAPSARLRQVLSRRIERSVREHDTDPAEAAIWLEEVVSLCRRLGYIDDDRFAQARAARLQRSGLGRTAIRQRLSALGLSGDSVDGALQTLTDDAEGDSDLAAALTYCRKRRIGPWRPEEQRAGNRDRDLAALGRRGFSYDTARRALESDPDETT